jgi:HD-like signal output (HDOD) protein
MSQALLLDKPAKGLEALLDDPDLPAMPAATLRILKLAGDAAATISDLGDAVATDPSLTAKVLKLANSALLNRGRPFSDVRRAVAHLGMAQIRSLALATQLFSFKPTRPNASFDYGQFWRSCLTCAAAAKLLAAQLRTADPEEAFTAGLLQDLGVLALQQAHSETYARIQQQGSSSKEELCQAESAALGYDHADVGAALASSWSLPDSIAHAIQWHHRPGDNLLARICFLGDMVLAAVYEAQFVSRLELTRVLQAYRCDDTAVLTAMEAELPRIADACGCPSWDLDAEDHLKQRIRNLLETG